jgi:abortive infection bacteriophage resistance protein
MRNPYEKQHLSTADQVSLLADRGMDVGDPGMAATALLRIGYYRLSEYWHPMRQSRIEEAAGQKPKTVVLETFKANSRFADAFDLYVFDKRLRLLMLDAIERVEVALRVDCAHHLGQRDAYIHRDWRALDPDFVEKDHATWLARVDGGAAKAREDFVHAFRKEYLPPLPIWVSIETWDFGILSYFVNGLKTTDKTAMADRFGLPRRDLLTSWARSINGVRNHCAHHARLWNRVLVDRPSPPKPNENEELEHLARYPLAHNRIYSVAVALHWFLRAVNPRSSWSRRLKELVATFPHSPHADFRSSGFPSGWNEQPLWRDQTGGGGEA